MKLIGEGRQAEVYDLGDGRCLKLFFKGTPASAAEYEARITALAWERGLSAPRCYEVAEVDGRFGIIMESLSGVTMLKDALAHPEKGAEYGYLLGAEHKKLSASSGEGFPDMVEYLCKLVGYTDMLSPAERDFICDKIRAMPKGDRIVHIDFHLENILVTETGLRVIDWTGACRGDPLADVARTTLINEAPVYPVGADADMRQLIDKFKLEFTANYFKGYGITRADVEDWLPLIAAARLCSKTEGELEYDYQIARDYIDRYK